MAQFTHTLRLSYVTAEGTTAATVETNTDNTEASINDAVAPQSTKEFDINIDVSLVKSMCLFSDKEVTIKTNSIASPGDEIVIPAGQQIVWTINSAFNNPLSVDVTKIFVVNAGTVASNFTLRVLWHSSTT
jgi:hypothetical protein